MLKTFIICLMTRNLMAELKEGDSCVNEHTNILGKCTPPDKCMTAKNDFQFNGIRPTYCVHSFDQLLICCRDGSSILQAAGSGSVGSERKLSTDGRRVSERKCEEYSKAAVKEVEFIPLELVPDGSKTIKIPYCLHSSVELIVGGQVALNGEFPHMAAVGWPDYDGGYKFGCGGTLISPRFVLTAGHCARDPRAFDPRPAIVRLGDQNIDPSVKDGANPIDVPIKTIYTHPDFKPPKKYNDIALFELAADVDIEENIRPACLWTRPDFWNHTRAIATGWGIIDTVLREPSKELNKVSLPLLENEPCDKLLAPIIHRHFPRLASTQLCAGELSGGKDTCQGDSGSPLQVTSSDNHCIFHVLGVTSFGKNCALRNTPSIYTRVSSYLDWIESIVWPDEV